MSPTYSKCKCCDQQVEIKTINDMLEYAYLIIDSNPTISNFFSTLELDKHSIGICQNATRLKTIENPFRHFSNIYRAIQGTESGIYLCFNEMMDELEAIEIKPYLFREDDIRGWGTKFNHLNNIEKIQLIENAFTNFSSTLLGLSNYVEYCTLIDNERGVALKKDNKRLKENYTSAYYPGETLEYPYFEFTIDHKQKDGRLKMIKLLLKETKITECPISLWLHQGLINMYPNFGSVYLWFDGIAGDIDSLKGYDFTNTDLPQLLQEWEVLFLHNDDIPNPDWDKFNIFGREIHKKLQNIVKDQYIIAYCKSFQETYGNEKERKAKELNSSL